MLRETVVCVACLAVLGCGSSEPRSALILGGNPAEAQPGPRTLTGSQARALRNVIASAGESCASIERAYLRDVDGVGESWEVRCTEAPYMVMIPADGTPSAVRRCIGSYLDASPCRQPYAGRSRSRTPGPLNPDLGKLLEPMTSKDGKTD
jgi:hypothetical protein